MGAAGHSGVKSDPDPGKGLGWSCDFVILFGIFSFWDYYCSFRRVCYIFFFLFLLGFRLFVFALIIMLS